MKYLVSILVLGLAVKINGEVCGFCPNGIENPDGEVSDDSGTYKCSSLGAIAMTLEEEDSTCDSIKLAAGTCCPSQVVSCGFCPSGVDDASTDTVVPDSDGNTCGSLAALATSFPDNTHTCDEFKLAHYMCCPNDIVVAGNCTFCETSGFIDPNIILPDSDGVTCAGAKFYASSLDDTRSEECAQVQLGQAACCPEVCQGQDGCPFCPNGVENPSALVGEGNMTCSDLEVMAACASEMFCGEIAMAQLVCCPAGKALCPFMCGEDQMMMGDENIIFEDGLNITCAEVEENSVYLTTKEQCDMYVNDETTKVCCMDHGSPSDDKDEDDDSATAISSIIGLSAVFIIPFALLG